MALGQNLAQRVNKSHPQTIPQICSKGLQLKLVLSTEIAKFTILTYGFKNSAEEELLCFCFVGGCGGGGEVLYNIKGAMTLEIFRNTGLD